MKKARRATRSACSSESYAVLGCIGMLGCSFFMILLTAISHKHEKSDLRNHHSQFEVDMPRVCRGCQQMLRVDLLTSAASPTYLKAGSGQAAWARVPARCRRPGDGQSCHLCSNVLLTCAPTGRASAGFSWLQLAAKGRPKEPKPTLQGKMGSEGKLEMGG